MSTTTTDNNIQSSSSFIAGLTLRDDDNVNTLRFDDYYELDEKLNSGSFGIVYKCRPRCQSKDKGDDAEERQQCYAVKIIDCTKIKKKDVDSVYREVTLLQEATNISHVVTVIDFFVHNNNDDDESNPKPNVMHVVETLAAGGDVFDKLSERTSYTENDARELSKILMNVIASLHDLQIVHRDLKPENLLLQSKDDDTSILLCDFGFARKVSARTNNCGAGSGYCETRCGTPSFVAPEIVTGAPYGLSVDLWSTGCLIFMLLGGYPPFQAENHRALFRLIRSGDYIFHNKYFANVSVPAKRLISHLLTVNVQTRCTAKQALECEWFRNADSTTNDILKSHDLSLSCISSLKQFKAKQCLKSATDAVRWAMTAKFWNSDKISFQKQMVNWDKEAEAENEMPTTQNPSNKLSASAPPTTGLQGIELLSSSLMGKLPRIRFVDAYDLKEQIRTGACATIWEAIHRITKEKYAVKIIQRSGLKQCDDQAVLNEVAILQSLNDNKYVVQLMDFYEEDDAFYLVMEYMSGGDVFDRLLALNLYTEEDARDLVERLLKAVASLHKLGIAHRDCKPQNLLLKDNETHSEIKIGGFGFSARVHTPESLTTRVGTPTYVAPEILKNIPHDERCDLWSIGVIAYVLLVGYGPFMDDNQQLLFQKIREGKYTFYKEDWSHISSDAKQLINGLLKVDPKDRLSIDDALLSPWINHPIGNLSSVHLTESLMTLKSKKNRLRKLTRTFMWAGGGNAGGGGGGGKAKDLILKPIEVVTQAQDTVSSVIGKVSRPSSATS